MQYYFQFGRDGELSKLELASVLTLNDYKYSVVFQNESEFILDFQSEINIDVIIERLAGTLKIGKIFRVLDKLDSSVLNQIDFYFPKNFVLYISSDNIEFDELESLHSMMKKYTKSAKLRGSVKVIKDDLLQASSSFNHSSDSVCEVAVIKTNEKYYYSQIIHYANPDEFKNKDENRPSQKFTHGSSFRLAKMMINMLGLEKGKTIVDPFSGIGTFLTEGMIAGYNVIGIDNDSAIHQAARKNMEWAVKEYNLKTDYELIFGDSVEAEFKADACVFEPYMGPFLKDLPKLKQAKKTVQELHNLYVKIFKNLHSNLSNGAKVVCVLPSFQTLEGPEIKIPNDLFSQTGFEYEDVAKLNSNPYLQNPISYSAADGSRILRKVYVLRKK